ncbi:MAG TPA: hypothetical protein VK034_01460, partial [Enhygromyxa sp.]|nr:hypothetical protein [Enhygromyxa sp.]
GAGGPGGWNPLGTARFYLQACRVLGGVGPDGKPITSSDPLHGAPVATPSPATPTGPDGVDYSLPKLVDLDPDMQMRSEVYGMRVWVEIPGSGAGFWGTMSVPQLRNMNGRTPPGAVGGGGSWTAVGTMAGAITDVKWLGDASVSPLLSQFKAACAQGISYRLTVDLHQNSPSTQFTSGNLFYYGRVHGCFGPAYPQSELAQVVPGRMLQVPTQSATMLALTEARTREFRLEAIASQNAAAAASAPVTLNASPAQVNSLPDGSASLAVDLGGASLLALGPNNEVLGKYQVDQGITLGYLGGSGFVPFAAQPVSFSDQYDDRLIGNEQKSCFLVRNTGVADVPLTSAEAQAIASAPLAIQVEGQLPLQEYASGYWIELSEGSRRLQPGEQATVQMMVRQFGAPVTGTPPSLGVQVLASNWTGDKRPFHNEVEPSTAVQFTVGESLDENGLVDVTVAGTTPEPLGTLRSYMDSKVFFVQVTDPDGNPIGDEPTGIPALSVLLWAPYSIPANPTWESDVGPILDSYARLYPGMKSILDIGDLRTVMGSAGGILGRMSLPHDDPAYMPVTRDLSPNKVATVVKWLAAQGKGETV